MNGEIGVRVVAVGVIALLSLVPARAGDALPAWMAGHWLSCTGGERVAETWIAGETMLAGTNITVAKTRESFEFMRVASNGQGGLAFFAMPNGKPATAFDLALHEDQRAVFENPGHDFPQRVIYRREGDVLHARIEGVTNGKAESAAWLFRAARPGQACKP